MKKTPYTAALLAAAFLCAAGAGCSGGIVYRPDPEPRQELPMDISIEQDIYKATARPQQAAPPEPAKPADKHEPPGRIADNATAAQNAAPLFHDTICIGPDGKAYSFFAGIRKNDGVFYSLNLHSFRRFDYAMIDAKKLAQQTGRPVFVKRVELAGSGIWHRVYVGKFPTKAAAESFAQSLQDREEIQIHSAVHALPSSIIAEPGA